MNKFLEEFYNDWYKKSDDRIRHDIESALRKSEIIIRGLKKIKGKIKIETMIDFGCGYGAVLGALARYLNIKKGFGFDFSQAAIDYAKKVYEKEALQYFKLESLDNIENVKFIKLKIGNIQKVDCILLIDLLEHVPDCIQLIAELSKITKYFIIKLPIESSIFDNYILPKQYPGPGHSNGHLREFNVNDVYYFARKIGLKQIFEETYVYNIYDTVPSQETEKRSAIISLKYSSLRFFKLLMSFILPKRIFLSLIGGGGYWCIATYDKDYMLNP